MSLDSAKVYQASFPFSNPLSSYFPHSPMFCLSLGSLEHSLLLWTDSPTNNRGGGPFTQSGFVMMPLRWNCLFKEKKVYKNSINAPRSERIDGSLSKKWKQEVKRCQHFPMTPLSHQAHINWQRCCFREELFQTRASLQRSPFFKPLNKYKQHSYRLLITREKKEREKYMR